MRELYKEILRANPEISGFKNWAPMDQFEFLIGHGDNFQLVTVTDKDSDAHVWDLVSKGIDLWLDRQGKDANEG